MEIYQIFVDASFKPKISTKYSGAYITYLNERRVCSNSYIRGISNIGAAEIYNLNKAMTEIANKYLNDKEKQFFIFKTDSKGTASICNNIVKKISTGNIDYKSLDKEKFMLSATIRRFKNKNIMFQWIPRDENKEADKLATDTFEEYLKKMGLENKIEYMKSDLEYTLNKWHYWGIDEKYTQKLNDLILEIGNGL